MFQVKLRGRPAPDPDRQHARHFGEREDRASHHEAHPRRPQPVRGRPRGGEAPGKPLQPVQDRSGQAGRLVQALSRRHPQTHQRDPRGKRSEPFITPRLYYYSCLFLFKY